MRDMERLQTLKEYLQRELPLYNRAFAARHPVTALINLVKPLLSEEQKWAEIEAMDKRVKKLEGKVGQSLINIEIWLASPKNYVKVWSRNRWGKKVIRKVYKREIEREILSLVNWIYSEMVYSMLYDAETDIGKIKKVGKLAELATMTS